MAQSEIWEREYRHPQLLTRKPEPQTDLKDFLRFLRKHEEVALEGLRVLDLGSGTGRNGNYIAKLGNSTVGLEISETAVALARQRASDMGVAAEYRLASFGETYPFADESFDVAIDVTSSNSLNEKEREIYVSETRRVLKKGGYLFVKALCKDGDKNAKNLLKLHPGPEADTYINPDLGLTERVFTRQDFIDKYGKSFKILRLQSKANYTRFNGQPYKRHFWLAYLRKEEIDE